jgi:hypothetical protein
MMNAHDYKLDEVLALNMLEENVQDKTSSREVLKGETQNHYSLIVLTFLNSTSPQGSQYYPQIRHLHFFHFQNKHFQDYPDKNVLY